MAHGPLYWHENGEPRGGRQRTTSANKKKNVERGLRILTSGAVQMVNVARHQDLQDVPLFLPQTQKADRNDHLVLHELQDGAAALNVRRSTTPASLFDV